MIHIQLQRYDPRVVLESRNPPPQTTALAPFGADGFTFGDVVDVVNPLQHIPVIGSLYRKITGDQIDPGARIAGGALFGGVIGALVSAAAVVYTQARADARLEHSEPSTQLASQAQRVDHHVHRPTHANAGVAQGKLPEPTHQSEPRASATVERRRGGWMVEYASGKYAARTNPHSIDLHV